MILVFIPVIIYIVLYAYRLYSDETSAIEEFRTAEHARDKEGQDETVARKSSKSEKFVDDFVN